MARAPYEPATPPVPPHVLAEVAPEVMRSKNTLAHHDAQRVAAHAIDAGLRAAGTVMSDAELRPYGLRRLHP